MSTNDTLMEQCRREAPYTILRLNDRHAPTYVLYGGPYHVASFWVTHREAQSACDQLNAVHAAAMYAERSKPRTGLSVEEIMECIPKAIERGQLNETYLRKALTEKLNQTNG